MYNSTRYGKPRRATNQRDACKCPTKVYARRLYRPCGCPQRALNIQQAPKVFGGSPCNESHKTMGTCLSATRNPCAFISSDHTTRFSFSTKRAKPPINACPLLLLYRLIRACQRRKETTGASFRKRKRKRALYWSNSRHLDGTQNTAHFEHRACLQVSFDGNRLSLGPSPLLPLWIHLPERAGSQTLKEAGSRRLIKAI